MKKSLFVLLASSGLLLAGCGETPAASSTANATTPPEVTTTTQTNTATTPSSTSTQDTIPAIEGTNVYYSEGIFVGGESDAVANPGRFYYWAGDGGSVSDAQAVGDGYALTYTACGTATESWGWYSVQAFYTAPYALGGETYTIRLIINSDIGGDITFNGKVVTLVRGDNVITETFTRGAEGARASTISIQLGTNAPSTLGGYIITFKSIEIYDAVNTYYQTKFLNGEEVVKDIQVMAGQTVSAPRIAAPEGKILSGWYDGETLFNPNAPVTAAHNYSAVFVDESEGTSVVDIYYSEIVIQSITVLTGGVLDVSEVEIPFGYRLLGIYTDEELSAEFDAASPISEDLSLYLKLQINPVFWINSEEAGYTFHDEVSYDDNGAMHLAFNGWGADNWHVQVNFAPLPIGEAGKTYACRFAYSINAEGGDYKIYDGGDITTAKPLLPVEEVVQYGSVTYQGGTLTAANKLTIELGAIAKDTPVEFTLYAIAIAIEDTAHDK